MDIVRIDRDYAQRQKISNFVVDHGIRTSSAAIAFKGDRADPQQARIWARNKTSAPLLVLPKPRLSPNFADCPLWDSNRNGMRPFIWLAIVLPPNKT